MTKFEKVLSEMLDEYGSDPDRMKDCVIEKYGKAIRKSIVSEIDTWKMNKDYQHYQLTTADFYITGIEAYKKRCAAYRQGIEDTLKEIGGK